MKTFDEQLKAAFLAGMQVEFEHWTSGSLESARPTLAFETWRANLSGADLSMIVAPVSEADLERTSRVDQ